MTKKEIEKKLNEKREELLLLEENIDLYNSKQLALKNVINGAYGAFANAAFSCSNNEIANSITAMGRDIIKYIAKKDDEYWKQKWHLDTEAHKMLNVTNVKQIPKNAEIWVYTDTDSIDGESTLNVKIGEVYQKIKIKTLWYILKSKIEYSQFGHECADGNGILIESYNEYTNKVEYFPIKYVIAHKVKKPKWKLTLKNGKSIICTNDHSMIVWRNDKLLVVKPHEILKTDKIITN